MANILVYAHRRDADFHRVAVQRVREPAEGRSAWAIAQIEAWLASPTLSVLGEPPGYREELRATLTGGKVTGPMVHDARIAALCAAHGVRELWSADRVFGRFGSPRVRNPLVDQGRQPSG